MHTKQTATGQVLPLVALMMVAILGVAAFAIDGSNMYSQHRKLQADLDVAVKVAAAKMFNYSPTSAVYTNTAVAAIQSAAQILANDGHPNGLVNATYPMSASMQAQNGGGLCGVDNTAGIKICTPPTDGPFRGRYDYTQGFLASDIHGYFGGVIGLDRSHESVRADAWHGGAPQPFTILSLDTNPATCGVQVQDAAGTLMVYGSIHSNSQTCNNGTAIITGTVESVIQSSNPISGSLGNTNGGVKILDNPYTPSVPRPMAPAITICSSGCTATGFDDPALNLAGASWAYGGGTLPSGSHSCFAYLNAMDPNLQLHPGPGVTYYLPPDAPNPPNSPWGTTALVQGFSAVGGEYDFLPHCDSSDPAKQTSAIYYFSGSPNDIKTSSGPALNSFNAAFVLDPNASVHLIQSTGNVGDQWSLQAPLNGPLQGMALYEDEPCSGAPMGAPGSIDMLLAGSANSQINGTVDLACANLNIRGNSTNLPFINGALVAWTINIQGTGTALVKYNPLGAPPDRGSVLVE